MNSPNNELRINIHMVNVDIATNLQNILRSKFENIAQKLSRVQEERGIKKSLVYINNRDLKPIDLVLRMNQSPEVALLGFSIPNLGDMAKKMPPSMLRSKVLSSPQVMRYKKAFLGQRLRNTLTVLVGNIDQIVTRAADYGLSLTVHLKSRNQSKAKTEAEIIDMARQSSLIADDIADQETIEIETAEDW